MTKENRPIEYDPWTVEKRRRWTRYNSTALLELSNYTWTRGEVLRHRGNLNMIGWAPRIKLKQKERREKERKNKNSRDRKPVLKWSMKPGVRERPQNKRNGDVAWSSMPQCCENWGHITSNGSTVENARAEIELKFTHTVVEFKKGKKKYRRSDLPCQWLVHPNLIDRIPEIHREDTG